MAKPRIGVHVSGAGGLDRAPDNAKALGCEVFQFFSRSPRGGRTLSISRDCARSFREKCRREEFESYIHAPYYINFASSNNRVSFGSVSAVREELQRGTLLGVKYVMTHLGSSSGVGKSSALKQVIARLQAVFDPRKSPSGSRGKPFTTQLLLEISAGAGEIIGDTFEELGFILRGLGRNDVGICLDSCHLFASGYDLRTPHAITETMRLFRQQMPLARFKLLHASDSASGFGEHKDRHADIGDGELGTDTFRALLRHPAFQGRNFILETPGEDPRRKRDVALLKKMRNKK